MAAFVPDLSVRQIYDLPNPLQAEAVVPASIVLLRAQTGEADDTPYREIYTDETLGWGFMTSALTVVDVDGGHSSMLQEPFVESLAAVLLAHVRRDPQSKSPRFLEGALERPRLFVGS